jgi:TetR/AcrR family transcriptional regulator, mexJK operon transcriptional repressor
MDSQGDGQERRTRGRPRSGKAEMIENELLEGALQVFLRNGYGGTSMAEIVKLLGISKTTLYSRYPSKEVLFQAILVRQIKSLSVADALQVNGTRLPLEAGLRSYAQHTLEVSFKGDLLQVNRLIYSESYRFPELGIAAAERTDHGIRQIAAFIAACAVQDGIPCRDPTGIASAFIFMLRGWYVSTMLTNEPTSEMAVRRFVELAVNAILSNRAAW